MNSQPDSTAMVEHHGAQRGMTRIRKVILYRLKEGYPVEAIHDLYPWVHIQVVEGALDEAIQLVNTTIHAEKLL